MPARSPVTVVIPTHNRRALLMRTLRSVLGQVAVSPKVIVVDDGGRDGTSAALEKYAQHGVSVRRHETARGVSAARNAGLAEVDTPWVAFVDDDDLWAPDKLVAQLTAVQDSSARWACAGAVHVDETLRALSHTPPPPSGHVAHLLRTRNVVPGGGSGVLVDSDLARDIGGFDERVSLVADWDFNLRLSRRSPVAAVNRPLIGYYVHADSMLHDPLAYLRELRYLVEKYETRPGQEAFVLDSGYWHANLAWMARGLGDVRTARALLMRGVAEAGVVTMGRELGRLLGHRLGRAAGEPFRFTEPTTWLQDVAHD